LDRRVTVNGGDRRGVVITGLLNKMMTTSSRLSPTPVALRIANWMMSSGK
jgi:hypothetical protein